MERRLMAATVAVVLGLACHPGPIVDTGPRPPATAGTISGMVRASAGNTPLSGRKVTVTDVATGRRYEVSTATNGGYTVKVPEGTYRLEVELRSNERLASAPEQTEVNRGDLDPGRDFAIAVNSQP